MRRDSAVGIATGYGLDDREVAVQVPAEARIFTSPMHIGGPFPGGKAAGA
jgi:hypothetical protein